MEPTKPRRRWQYSMRTLLIVVTLGVLLMALWATNRELRRIRAEYEKYKSETDREIAKYRKELGHLDITDPMRVHAARIPSLDDTWQWRVYIPKGRKINFRFRVGQILEDGRPSSGSGGKMYFGPGEHVIRAGVGCDSQGKRAFMVKGPGGGTSHSLEGRLGAWLDKPPSHSSTGVLGAETTSVEPGKTLTLVCLRVHETVEEKQPDGTVVKYSKPAKGPADGFHLWIEDPDGAKVAKQQNGPPAKTP